MLDKTDELASRHLGKKSDLVTEYDSSLLVAVPRFDNRIKYNIDENNLPFVGYDTWHAYEFSCLTENGVPVTKVLKLKYNCNNKFIIESKSLKLYLNSFNMSRFGKTIDDCLNICKSMIQKDLSEKLETEVLVEFLADNISQTSIFTEFKNIMSFVNEAELNIECYKEKPELLIYEQTSSLNEYFLRFDSLRSNCRVTHQPDFGKAFIYYKSKKHISEKSLVEYLTSFRTEYHFHEECCEMIYKRLMDLLEPEDELFVSALYTRRGGIDICPSRWSKSLSVNLAQYLIDLKMYSTYGIQQ